MKNFNKFVKLARQLIDYPDGRCRHWSFLVIRNKILSVGWNLSNQTHPLARQYGYRFHCIHSELKAILNLQYTPSIITKCTLINICIMTDGTLGMSKPCKRCQQLLQDFGVKTIYYTNRQGKFRKMI
jgi:deoxycytidylate deaminase